MNYFDKKCVSTDLHPNFAEWIRDISKLLNPYKTNAKKVLHTTPPIQLVFEWTQILARAAAAKIEEYSNNSRTSLRKNHAWLGIWFVMSKLTNVTTIQ